MNFSMLELMFFDKTAYVLYSIVLAKLIIRILSSGSGNYKIFVVKMTILPSSCSLLNISFTLRID